MLSNFHTHCILCDGKDVPKSIVESAIALGFSALGFSSHAYIDFDTSYCVKDEEAYICQITSLKEEYKDKIEIYVGAEEDAFCLTRREKFEYIIGSLHYVRSPRGILPIDLSEEGMRECLSAFGDDALALAKSYYEDFCAYIYTRRPDIVGHFDLITKYDERGASHFLENPHYHALAERYAAYAAEAGCIFEINTGAVARGLRTSPYPALNLIHVLKKKGARFILSSDSHAKETLDFGFEEAKTLLREAGIREAVTIKNGSFVTYGI